MKIKRITAAICIYLLGSSVLLAEEAQVEIQKLEGRTEAIVTSVESGMPQKSEGWLEDPFMIPERLVVGTARITSKVIGQITDTAVLGVQTASGVILSPVVHVLDVKNWNKESN